MCYPYLVILLAFSYPHLVTLHWSSLSHMANWPWLINLLVSLLMLVSPHSVWFHLYPFCIKYQHFTPFHCICLRPQVRACPFLQLFHLKLFELFWNCFVWLCYLNLWSFGFLSFALVHSPKLWDHCPRNRRTGYRSCWWFSLWWGNFGNLELHSGCIVQIYTYTQNVCMYIYIHTVIIGIE